MGIFSTLFSSDYKPKDFKVNALNKILEMSPDKLNEKILSDPEYDSLSQETKNAIEMLLDLKKKDKMVIFKKCYENKKGTAAAAARPPSNRPAPPPAKEEEEKEEKEEEENIPAPANRPPSNRPAPANRPPSNKPALGPGTNIEEEEMKGMNMPGQNGGSRKKRRHRRRTGRKSKARKTRKTRRR
jgi:hypothetical protein